MSYAKSHAKSRQTSKQYLNNFTKYYVNHQRQHFNNRMSPYYNDKRMNTYYVTLGLSKNNKNLVTVFSNYNKTINQIKQSSMSQQLKLIQVIKIRPSEASIEIPKLVKKYKHVDINKVETIDWSSINE